MEKHLYPILILEKHLDTFGHMNNATYLQLFEEARWDMITGRGYGLEKVHETRLGPTVLEVVVKFRRELKLRQKVLIETQVTSYRKKIAIVSHRIIDDAGLVYCNADFTFGLFNLHTRKLTTPTPEWLKALGIPGAANDSL